ncbi:MAG TPA: response regulator [Roseiflexaceae bacterium]|nr:response regulator [Roseiflexaceae bacterium]
MKPIEARLRQRGILVIDGDPDIKFMLSCALRRWGWEPLICGNDQDALELAADPPLPLGCALLDVSLRRPHGLETAARLAAVDPALPIVLLSSADWVELPAPNINVAGVLWKPFALADLSRLLTRAAAPAAPRPSVPLLGRMPSLGQAIRALRW